MGLILLDMTFRVERAFKIRIPKHWHDEIGMSWKDKGSDATLRQYHDYVLRLCRDQSTPSPADSWPLLVSIVEAASGMNRSQITEETRLIRDIGPHG